MEKRKFRLADVVLSVICVVFVAEAAAPVASIGNSQYFWWLFMIAAFLLPYGLISSELGTAFPGDGGLYDWIHTAVVPVIRDTASMRPESTLMSRVGTAAPMPKAENR